LAKYTPMRINNTRGNQTINFMIRNNSGFLPLSFPQMLNLYFRFENHKFIQLYWQLQSELGSMFKIQPQTHVIYMAIASSRNQRGFYRLKSQLRRLWHNQRGQGRWSPSPQKLSQVKGKEKDKQFWFFIIFCGYNYIKTTLQHYR